jgi:regulator of sigma E protease
MAALPGSRGDSTSGTTGPEPNASRAQRPSGAALNLPPGTRILAVDDRPVSTLYQLREALRDTAGAGEGPVSVVLRVRRALPEAGDELIRWTISPEELKVLRALTWRSPLPPSAFELDQFLLRSDTFGGALFMGLRETHRVMLQTYLTFARLFQGTVKVEHLRGPVGIAHVGTLIADRGLIWLMFLMAVISVNLAVINFLPLPIVDGGHFLFLLWEQLTGRPVSVGVQNVATLAGLLLIGAVFLIVTYNDLARLITGG